MRSFAIRSIIAAHIHGSLYNLLALNTRWTYTLNMRTLFLTLALAMSSLASSITFEVNSINSQFHSPVLYATEEIQINSFTFAYTVLGNPVGPITENFNFIANVGRHEFTSIIFNTVAFGNPQFIGQSSWSLGWSINGIPYTTSGNSLQIGGSTPVQTPEPPTMALLGIAAGTIAWRKKGAIA